MSSAGTQLTYTVRRLRRSPMFAALTLLTLGIGVGANTAMFSVVYGVLLKPLPYPDAGRLVGVWERAPGLGIDDLNASPATYFTFREEGQSFEDIGIWQGDSVSVTGNGEPEQVAALDVSDGTLPILGVHPVRGRWFSKKDDAPGSPETMLLT